MKSWIIIFVLALAMSHHAQALTVDELIQKNIEAKGGLEKIKAIKSVKSTGTMSFAGGGFELKMTALQARPLLIRTEATMQGMTAIQAYDGKSAWAVQPFGGRKDPIRTSADEAKGLIDRADIDGELIDYAAKGSKVEYLGTDDVDGTPAHKIKVTKKNGDTKTIFLDPDYFLEIRIQDAMYIRGELQEVETDLGSYELVNGVYMPFSIEAGGKGDSEKGQKITFDKVEFNVEVDPNAFAFPETAKTP